MHLNTIKLVKASRYHRSAQYWNIRYVNKISKILWNRNCRSLFRTEVL